MLISLDGNTTSIIKGLWSSPRWNCHSRSLIFKTRTWAQPNLHKKIFPRASCWNTVQNVSFSLCPVPAKDWAIWEQHAVERSKSWAPRGGSIDESWPFSPQWQDASKVHSPVCSHTLEFYWLPIVSALMGQQGLIIAQIYTQHLHTSLPLKHFRTFPSLFMCVCVCV